MLKAVNKLAPRGVYVCGNTTSASGLTVTMTKVSFLDKYLNLNCMPRICHVINAVCMTEKNVLV